MKELLVVSRLDIVAQQFEPTELAGMSVLVNVAAGHKCPRCWHYHESSNNDNLCQRCALILN
jgi:isoleucyl-tRNA synthetase